MYCHHDFYCPLKIIVRQYNFVRVTVDMTCNHEKEEHIEDQNFLKSRQNPVLSGSRSRCAPLFGCLTLLGEKKQEKKVDNARTEIGKFCVQRNQEIVAKSEHWNHWNHERLDVDILWELYDDPSGRDIDTIGFYLFIIPDKGRGRGHIYIYIVVSV